MSWLCRKLSLKSLFNRLRTTAFPHDLLTDIPSRAKLQSFSAMYSVSGPLLKRRPQSKTDLNCRLLMSLFSFENESRFKIPPQEK
jgi:hypothetical protein